MTATTLYDFSASQCLPRGEFLWLSQNEINKVEIHNIHDNTD